MDGIDLIADTRYPLLTEQDRKPNALVARLARLDPVPEGL